MFSSLLNQTSDFIDTDLGMLFLHHVIAVEQILPVIGKKWINGFPISHKAAWSRKMIKLGYGHISGN